MNIVNRNGPNILYYNTALLDTRGRRLCLMQATHSKQGASNSLIALLLQAACLPVCRN